jgi:hypothetical protein
VSQKRILIGSFASILVFSFVLLLGNKFWAGANQIILDLQSKISLKKKYKNKKAIFLDFDKENKKVFLKEKSSIEKRDAFVKIFNELDAINPSSINIVLDKGNILNLNQKIIDSLRVKLDTPIQSIKTNEIELEWLNENNEKVLLDHHTSKVEKLSLADFQTGFLEEAKLRSKNIFVLSPKLKLSNKDLNLLLNYFENRSINFIPFSNFLLFLSIFSFAIVSSLMSYPPRIALFGSISVVAFISSQISYSFFNTHIEISTLILGLLFTLLAVSIFDVNFQEISSLNFLKQDVADELKNIRVKDYSIKKKPEPMPYIKSDEMPIESHHVEKVKEESLNEIKAQLKGKLYQDLETRLEEKALEIEEKCFDNVTNIQEKLIELLSESELSERDNLRLGVVKHNFDQLVNELDHCLFSMLPFHFEKEQGFIDILEHFVTKIYYQSRSKVQVELSSNVPRIEFDNEVKINTYRIIEAILDLVIEHNFNGENLLAIKVQIKEQLDGVNFFIGYQGMSIEKVHSYKIHDIKQRLETMQDTELAFETKSNFAYIKFKIKNGSKKQKTLV